jgi:hypothetical protein
MLKPFSITQRELVYLMVAAQHSKLLNENALITIAPTGISFSLPLAISTSLIDKFPNLYGSIDG